MADWEDDHCLSAVDGGRVEEEEEEEEEDLFDTCPFPLSDKVSGAFKTLR